MPYENPENQAASMRRYRARKKQPQPESPEPPADPVAAPVEWARKKLVVPPGHPSAGQPMELPAFAVDFLRDGWGAHESALCIARKTARARLLPRADLGILGRTAALHWLARLRLFDKPRKGGGIAKAGC